MFVALLLHFNAVAQFNLEIIKSYSEYNNVSLSNAEVLENRMVYMVYDANNSVGLWSTDATDEGTFELPLGIEDGPSLNYQYIGANTINYYGILDGAYVQDDQTVSYMFLHITDGTIEGTRFIDLELLFDENSDRFTSIDQFFVSERGLHFVGRNYPNIEKTVYFTDGTTAGTELLFKESDFENVQFGESVYLVDNGGFLIRLHENGASNNR